jgi:hypothetical protein
VTKLYLGKCDPEKSYQNWKPIPALSGFFNYQQKQSGKCVDGDGTNLYFNECDPNNAYQNFT